MLSREFSFFDRNVRIRQPVKRQIKKNAQSKITSQLPVRQIQLPINRFIISTLPLTYRYCLIYSLLNITPITCVNECIYTAFDSYICIHTNDTVNFISTN